ncbi:hypothetical protein ETC01_01555 [Geobacillus sp. NFOSA3]|nr:hypothetical protein [Geobacillus sp. NFOSA3]
MVSKRLLDTYSLDSLDNKDDTEKLARYHPFALESLKELSRPPPDDETERGNVGAKTPGDMGGFVIISDAEIHGASHTLPPLQPNLTSSGREAYPINVRYTHI